MEYFDMVDLPLELEHLLRILIAGMCGALIGYERKSRRKEAGTRTHFIVAVGAALIMVISKYGFMDLEGRDGVQIDPTKVASEIVSGIGFLGAGMIFMRKYAINGLTTAAGMWATAGVGMAMGAGLYILGIAATLMIYLTQIMMHSKYKGKLIAATQRLVVTVRQEKEATERFQKLIEERGLTVINFKAVSKDEEKRRLTLDMVVRLPRGMSTDELMPLLQEKDEILGIEVR
ncbi:MgtC/SapB family protein [Saccharibacillus sp. CPCC 101409]|uniref:MgtC/SapB family protein n=1 Tax=Saccharibacillus sp. CPCC 101409 TaxID=3058041 RepID=UPI00267232A7|nr:MgtC/SapB family protein [Saccharibacillus sp. CPCC 101409]MDO3410248.1 MgtC/SapB family protein [Saccharibacillus sp. CPCC 101409]